MTVTASKTLWQGVYPAATTQFTDSLAIDHDATQRVQTALVDDGVDGLIVLGTTARGSQEILVEGQTGLTFTPNDSDQLARQLERAVQDEQLRAQLAANGRKIVVEKFCQERMLDQIEAYFQKVKSTSIPV